MTTEHKERAHSKLGGSTANRWINCSGSVVLCADIPPTPPTDAALEGTLAHEIIQIVLEDFLEHKLSGSDPRKRIKQVESLLPEADSEAEEMLEAAIGFRDSVWKNLLNESITSKAYGIEEEFVFEESLNSYGFIDFWAIYIDDKAKRVGVICDFKYGTFPVDPKDNDQLLFYACALLSEIRKGGKDLDYVKCAIYQPRNKYNLENYNPYKEVKYTVKQLDAWRKKAMNAAHLIFVKQAPKFKTGKWCHFCQGKSLCKKYSDEISKETALKLLDPNDLVTKEVEKLSDDDVSKVLLYEDEIIEFLKAAKKYALGKVLNGGVFPGFKAVEQKGRRKWADKEAVIKTLTPLFGLEDICKFSPKGIGDITKLAKKEESKLKIIDSLIVTSEPSAILVPMSDKRDSISSTKDLLVVEEGDN